MTSSSKRQFTGWSQSSSYTTKRKPLRSERVSSFPVTAPYSTMLPSRISLMLAATCKLSGRATKSAHMRGAAEPPLAFAIVRIPRKALSENPRGFSACFSSAANPSAITLANRAAAAAPSVARTPTSWLPFLTCTVQWIASPGASTPWTTSKKAATRRSNSAGSTSPPNSRVRGCSISSRVANLRAFRFGATLVTSPGTTTASQRYHARPVPGERCLPPPTYIYQGFRCGLAQPIGRG